MKVKKLKGKKRPTWMDMILSHEQRLIALESRQQEYVLTIDTGKLK